MKVSSSPRPRRPSLLTARLNLLLTLTALVVASTVAQAHVGSGANCASCHSTARNGMTIDGFNSVTNLGSGAFKVFAVRPGSAVNLGIRVTDGHNEYGLAMVGLDDGGVQNPAHRLSYTPDSTWTKRSSYYSRGPSTSNKSWTFALVVKAGTPADFYRLRVRMAGTGGGRWAQEESLYLHVLPPPAAPTLGEPAWRDGVFTCKIPDTLAGYTYRLETLRQGSNDVWTLVAEVAGNGASLTLTDPQATTPTSLYRVRVD